MRVAAIQGGFCRKVRISTLNSISVKTSFPTFLNNHGNFIGISSSLAEQAPDSIVRLIVDDSQRSKLSMQSYGGTLMKIGKALRVGLSQLVVFGHSATIPGCGASDDEETAATSTEGDEIDEDELLESNPLAAAYPSGLALSVFPTETTSTALVQDEDADEDGENELPQEKVQERREILQGGADSECFNTETFDDRKGEAITCYEFDNDMNPFNNGPAGNGGTADGTHTDGEACLVAFARQEVLDATQFVDRALDTVAGMLCTVKKAGGDTELPADGEEKTFLLKWKELQLASRSQPQNEEPW